MDNSFDNSFFFNNLCTIHNKNALSCNQKVTSYKDFVNIMIGLFKASITWEVKFPLNIY